MQFLLIPLVAALDLRFAWTLNIGVTWHVVGRGPVCRWAGSVRLGHDHQFIFLDRRTYSE